MQLPTQEWIFSYSLTPYPHLLLEAHLSHRHLRRRRRQPVSICWSGWRCNSTMRMWLNPGLLPRFKGHNRLEQPTRCCRCCCCWSTSCLRTRLNHDESNLRAAKTVSCWSRLFRTQLVKQPQIVKLFLGRVHRLTYYLIKTSKQGLRVVPYHQEQIMNSSWALRLIKNWSKCNYPTCCTQKI